MSNNIVIIFKHYHSERRMPVFTNDDLDKINAFLVGRFSDNQITMCNYRDISLREFNDIFSGDSGWAKTLIDDTMKNTIKPFTINPNNEVLLQLEQSVDNTWINISQAKYIDGLITI